MGIRNSLSFLFLALAWLACIGVVSAGAPHQKDVSASVDVSNLDASHSVDPTAVVDYVVNFYENEVSEQDMDMVAAWLEQRKISVKEKQKAHYAAYIVAELNKAIGKIKTLKEISYNSIFISK